MPLAGLRTNSAIPIASSNSLIVAEIAPGLRPSWCAAAVMLPSSHTVTKVFRLRSERLFNFSEPDQEELLNFQMMAPHLSFFNWLTLTECPHSWRDRRD